MDKRLDVLKQSLSEIGLSIYALRNSVGSEMTLNDRAHASVKLRALIENLMQVHDLLIEPLNTKKKGSTEYTNPEQHPF